MPKTAVIAGCTGLVGQELLNRLLESDNYEKIVALTRKPLDVENEKMANQVIDFDKIEELGDVLKADDVFCCLGTTMKKAGTREKFRKVDYEYPLKLAQITRQQGASKYLLISALGADKKSSVFYNRVKGEVEEAIAEVGFDTFHIFRPSLLMGPRQEERVGEDAAKTFYKVFGFLFVGPLKKYKAITYDKVAKAMLSMAQSDKHGMHIHESLELQNY